MKRFHFALQPALSWREHLCDKERALLDMEARAEASLQAQLERVREQLLAGVQETAIEATELHRIAAYRVHLRDAAARLEVECSIRKNRVEQQRARCLEAERDRLILEKLRQSRLAEWKRDVDRELETQSAEFFSHKWIKSQRA